MSDWFDEYLRKSSRRERRGVIVETALWALLPLGLCFLAIAVWMRA